MVRLGPVRGDPRERRLGLAGTNPPAGNDLRKLDPASLTLAAVTLDADRNAPVLGVVAVPGTDKTAFDIIVTEPNILHSEIVQGLADSRVSGSDLTDFVSVDGRGTRTDPVVQSAADVPAPGRDTAHARYRVTVDAALEHGDVIVIERKAVLDRGGRGNRLIRRTVPKVKTGTAPAAGTGDLEITSVSIGNCVHGNRGGDGHAQATILTESLRVTAKATGIASGARGNGWRIFGYDDRALVEASTNAFTITTAVDIADQRISYTIEDALPVRPYRAATIGDLAAELASNADFSANFSLSYVDAANDAKDDPLGATTATGVMFSGGVSHVGVVVKLNNAIFTAAADLAALATDIASRFTGTPAITITNPDSQVHISYTSGSTAQLPARSGFRVIAADRVTGYADTTASLPTSQQVSNAETDIREILNSLRPDTGIRP